MRFDKMEYELDAHGRITAERCAGEEFLPADDVILAIGQENAFPWIERDLGIEFDKWDVPVIDRTTFQSTRPGVFFGGDAAFGPKNIIWAVEHGHQAAISTHRHPQRARRGAAHAPQGAGEESRAAAVRVRGPAADRPRHGEGRGPVRALRPVRRALPDRSLGHAEVRAALAAGWGRSPDARGAQTQDCLESTMSAANSTRVNDFTIKIATVNGTGSASANTLLMKSIFRSGIPVMGKNYFPSNIQGLPTWYEIRVTRDGYVARSGRVEIMVAMNAETYARDVKEVAAGGYLIYDSTWPRPALLKREDITVLGVPLARLCIENFNGVRTRILMKNICYAGVLAALLDLDLAKIRELLAETYAKKPQLVDSNMKAIQLGYDYARQNFACPLPLHVEQMAKTAGHIMIDGNTAAALGCVFAGATVAAWYPIT